MKWIMKIRVPRIGGIGGCVSDITSYNNVCVTRPSLRRAFRTKQNEYSSVSTVLLISP